MSVVPMKLLTMAGPLERFDEVVRTCVIDQQFHPESTLQMMHGVKGLMALDYSNPYAALLRRAEFGRERRETLRCGDIECDTTTHTMRACGEELTLTLKEYELLHLMLEHPMQVFTRDRLLSSIWGYEFDGESRTVDVHIRSLRQKLGAAGGQIETVRGVGYRLRETAV